MLQKKSILSLCLMLFVGIAMNAQDFEYIGSKKCKMCHNKAETGAQYDKWMNSKHSQAMKSLSSPEALAYAKEHGIADPAKEASCIKCHSTVGHIDAKYNAGVTIDEGVSCESCHGPGSMYKSATIMKDQAKALANGLILPTKEVCIKCHNKDNPFYKPFDFASAVTKIAHPNPAKEQ
jgi:hypothetical protein